MIRGKGYQNGGGHFWMLMQEFLHPLLSPSALCPLPSALCSLCSLLSALCSLLSALCLCSLLSALCSHSLPPALCPLLSALLILSAAPWCLSVRLGLGSLTNPNPNLSAYPGLLCHFSPALLFFSLLSSFFLSLLSLLC
jgi:hypothetical protein